MGTNRFLLTSLKNTVVTPPPPPPDTAFKNVALLIHGNGSNSASNNTYMATGATGQISLTATGNPFEGTFTPYGSNWSTHLSGSVASYLTYGASASAAPGNKTFTIEGWVMFESLPSTVGSGGEYVLWQKGRTGTSNFELALGIQLISGGAYQILVQLSNGDGVTTVNANSANINLTAGTWHHFAITQVANSGACTFFFDGQLLNTFNHGVTNMYVGVGAASVGNNNIGTNPIWGGYISNVRVVFGSRVYTANFTPPTAPLTAITGTNFLGCQSNRWIDNSTNAWTISTGGSPAIRRLNPFGDNATPYSVSTYSGSCYFAGGGTNLSYGTSASFGFGTGAFTIECWIYMLSVNSNSCSLVGLRSAVAAQATELQVNTSGQLTFYDGPNNTVYSDPTALVLNQWNHVALTRDASGVWRLFKNGVQVATTTAADDLGSNQPIMIGQAINSTTNGFNGFMSDLRILKGNALYTGTFTPPSSPLDTTPTGIVLLFNGTDASSSGIFDNAMQQNIQTAGNAKISTAQQKFGSGALSFDGSASAYMRIPNSQMPVWGNADWTIEFWLYPTSSTSGGLFVHRTAYSSFAPVLGYFNSGNLELQYSTSGSSWNTLNATSGTPLNTWSHVAFVRRGSTITIYLNGVSVGTSSIGAALIGTSSDFLIGNASADGNNSSVTGFMQDMRITYGVAVYTANFSVPTGPLANQ